MIAGREGVGTVALSLRWPERNASLDINGAQPMHAASSIKLPVLVAALQRVAGGHLPPDAPIADRPLRAHLEDMVRRSDNDATNAVIMHLGLLQPGVAIHEQLGLSQSTQLVRLMGDLESVQRGVDNMTTTADLADLLVKLKSYAYSPAGAAPTAGLTEEACRILRLPKEGSAGQYAAIQNGLPPEAQGDVASKSGYIPSWLQDTYGDAAGTYVDAAIIYGADGVSVDSTWWTLAIVINGCTDDEAALTLMQDLARECWNGLRHIAEAQQLDAGQNQAAG
jgi:beta-lactamase class A